MKNGCLARVLGAVDVDHGEEVFPCECCVCETDFWGGLGYGFPDDEAGADVGCAIVQVQCHVCSR